MLVLPAGKSGHLEAGYLIGQGKPVYILLAGEPERFDVMYNFAAGVYTSLDELIAHRWPKRREDSLRETIIHEMRFVHPLFDHLPEGSH